LSSSEKTALRIVTLFQKFLGQSVLEVGGGLGQITDELVKIGCLTTVLEPDYLLFAELEKKFAGKESVTLINKNVQGLLAKDDIQGLFDSVIYINVLEHIADDCLELSLAGQTLRQEGHLIVFSPAIPFLYGSVDQLSHHYRRYTKSGLVDLVEQAGFQVQTVEYFDFVGMLPYFLMYRVLKIQSIGSGGMYFYDNIILPISSLLSRLTRKRIIGKNLLIIAKKPNDPAKPSGHSKFGVLA
jgi:SAM-dependent methyltransferase